VNLEKFYSITGYQFDKVELLEQALTHRSVSHSQNNERMEFLGDSILNLVITDHIYHRFPAADEGELSRIRASLVKEETLAIVARDIDLGDYIYLGGGELKSGGHRRESILSDALEAVIAAIYLDSNYAQAEQVILSLFRNCLQEISADTNLKDPKTRLQEHLQSQKMDLPIYEVTQTSGKSHSQVFTMSCSLATLNQSTKGEGTSRKKAEQKAADKMLEKLSL
jgi:ribonuclease-3